MIAAACAAVGLGAFAENTPEVYNMTITVKTTTCKAAQGKNVCDDDYSTFRVKATQKIQGLIWGCDCPTIAEPKEFESFDDFGTPDACHGYVFWDASVKTKNPYETAEFVWSDAAGIFENFLQCINPKCTEVEGVWTLTLKNKDDEYLVLLQGAGVGSAKWAAKYSAAYINSMNGNVTGWAFPGSLSYGCAACGETYEGCSAWAFCSECEERGEDYPSAAYGSWNLQFNTSAAKKYGKGQTRYAILDAYKFSDAVRAFLIAKDAEDPEPEVDDCTKAKATLVKLEAELAALDAKATELEKGIVSYNKIVEDCEAKAPALEAAYATAAATNAYAWACETNCTWVINYTNASQQAAQANGTGCATLTAAAEELKFFTLEKCTISLPEMYGWKTCTTWKAVADTVTELTQATVTSTQALETAKTAVDQNSRAKQIAQQGIVDNTAALADIPGQRQQLNAQIGTQKAIVDQVCD